jgi:hypothetical protein
VRKSGGTGHTKTGSPIRERQCDETTAGCSFYAISLIFSLYRCRVYFDSPLRDDSVSQTSIKTRLFFEKR